MATARALSKRNSSADHSRGTPALGRSPAQGRQSPLVNDCFDARSGPPCRQLLYSVLISNVSGHHGSRNGLMSPRCSVADKPKNFKRRKCQLAALTCRTAKELIIVRYFILLMSDG